MVQWPLKHSCQDGSMADFLHNHRDFSELLNIVADQKRIDPMLVEKDYWIMHCLWGFKGTRIAL